MRTADLFRLDNRTIVVTGALGGLAQELVPCLLESGADVVAIDQPQIAPAGQMQMYHEAALSHSRRLEYLDCDVRDAQAVAACFQKIHRLFPHPVRGLVVCAGLSERHDAVDYPIDDFRNVFDVNVCGSFLFAREAAKMMRDCNVGGSIVLLASMSATVVNQGRSDALQS